MKKKIFSAALLFAFTVATTSVFVSCKDYDDDINSLRTEITTNATTLTSLVNEKVDNLTAEISSLKSQQSTLESAYKAADEKLQAAITSAKTDANAYTDVQAAAAQKAAIEASQTALDDAVSKLEAAIKDANQQLSDLDAKYDGKVSDLDAKYEEKVNTLINADATLQAAIDEAIGKIAAAQATANAALDQANANSTAIESNKTSIESNKTAIESNATAIATLNTTLEKIKTDLTSQISILTADLKTTNETIATNKAEVDAQLDQVNSLIKTNSEAITALQGADKEMLAKIEANSKELASLAAELALVDGKLEANLAAAKAYTDAQLASLKSELGVAIDKVASDVAAAVIRIQAAEDKITALEEFQKEQTATNTAQTAKNEELESSIKALDEKIDANFDTYNKYVAATAQTIVALQDADKATTERLDSIKGVVDNLQATVKNALKDAGYDGLAALLAKVNSNAENIAANAESIKDNAGNISSNAAAISELQTKLSDIEATDTDLESRLKALEEYYSVLSGDAGTIKSFTESIAGLRTDVDNANAKVDALVEALNAAFADPNEPAVTADLATSITDAVNKAKTAITERLNGIDDAIASLQDALDEYQASYTTASDNFTKEIDRLSGDVRQLKSLIFSPTEYYGGIETIGMYTITYNDFTGFADADLTKDQLDADKVTPAKEATDVMPLASASYYLNPSNAAVELDPSHWSFIVNQATTRADEKTHISGSDITVDSVAYDYPKAGLVNVYFNMTQAALDKLSTGNEIDVAALRYAYKAATGDTVITSDFAALREYKIDSLILNKVAVEGEVDKEKCDGEHLFRTAKEAVEGEDTIAIAYNSTGVDLDKWINVHYRLAGNHQTWGGQSKVNEKKFAIQYELIGYISGNNKTNESAHATINGNMLTVHKYNSAEAAGKEIVGRKPLIRVKLVDETNNKVAAYGYICAKIVASTEAIPAVVMPENNDGYYLGCYDATNHEQVTTWDEIENKLLGTVNLSKSDFELLYKLETEIKTGETDPVAVLYSLEENGAYVQDTINRLGRVYYTATDVEGHKTNVLKWYVNGDASYKNFVTENNPTMEVYVKFVSTAGDENTTPIYVKLTWNPNGNINTKPAASIDDADKKKADWHAKDSRNAGYAEVHMQIGDPTTSGKAEFNQLTLANTFNSTIADIVAKDLKAAGYEALSKGSNTVEFTFTADQDKKSYNIENPLDEKDVTTYNIEVSNDDDTYSVIYAYNPKDENLTKDAKGNVVLDEDDIIVKMKKADGTIEVVEDNDIAQELINKTDNRNNVKAGDVLTLTVDIDVTACPATYDDANATPAKPIEIDLGTTSRFNVKVIKPLYVKSIDVDPMQWNNNETLTQDVMVSFEDFVGYNAGTYADHTGNPLDADSWKQFYDFYKITEVTIDPANAITDYSGSWKAIDPKDFTISFSKNSVAIPDDVTVVDWVSPYNPDDDGKTDTGAIGVGEVTLKQVNQSRSNAFDIKIPVTVTYALGKLTEYIPVHVNASK